MSAVLCEEKTVLRECGEGERSSRRVCFVCTGNTCRSPMAAAVANAIAAAIAKQQPENDITPSVFAESAGLYAAEGASISPNAARALEDAGVEPVPFADYRAHRASTLSEESAERCDLIVGMTSAHAMELMMRFPHLASRITCMPKPISDPFGGELARYAACLEEIQTGVRALLFGEEDA